MITILTSQIQSPHLSRWSSIRRGAARSNARFRSQVVHRSSSLEIDTDAHNKLLTPGKAVDQSARSPWLPSPAPSAALKSP
jgi:hypothetical protein